MPSLRDRIPDWTDIDFAAHALAQALGVMAPDAEMADTKWVYWSKNPLGDALVQMLDSLVEIGLLEKRDEPDFQYRWAVDCAARCGLAEGD